MATKAHPQDTELEILYLSKYFASKGIHKLIHSYSDYLVRHSLLEEHLLL